MCVCIYVYDIYIYMTYIGREREGDDVAIQNNGLAVSKKRGYPDSVHKKDAIWI